MVRAALLKPKLRRVRITPRKTSLKPDICCGALKVLKAGYLDMRGKRKDSLAGTPQGGIASPILSNVYLHELDVFVEELQAQREKGRAKRPNPSYRAIVAKRRRLIAKGRTKTREFRTLSRQMRSLPSQMEKDAGFIRIKYLRYADDWPIAVSGSHALAQDIKTFLKDHLKLTLSEEKTRITHAKTEEAFFLGTSIRMGSQGKSKQVTMTNAAGRTFKRRSTGWETIMKAPLLRLVKRLHEHGFCTPLGEPTAKSGWAYLDVDQIINLYSSVNRGIQNYYRFADNWKLKAFLRRVGARTPETLQEAIGQALLAITTHDALGWFTHCGYVPLQQL